jgi:hypothetical protein
VAHVTIVGKDGLNIAAEIDCVRTLHGRGSRGCYNENHREKSCVAAVEHP